MRREGKAEVDMEKNSKTSIGRMQHNQRFSLE
jgi:hypothetical protein